MIPWNIPQQTPIIMPGALHPPFDAMRAGAPHVIEVGGEYRMFYWGSDTNNRHYLLQAAAPIQDPTHWRPVGGILLGPQPETTYNHFGPSFPFVVPVTESRWLLYFCAWGKQADGKLPNTTGVAASEDGGKTWHYTGTNFVIALDRSYDSEGTGSVWILREHGKFRMYYTAIGKYARKPEGVSTGHGDMIPEIGIAYAESTDGIHWEKPVDHLIVAPRGFGVDPYEYICSKPCVVRQPDGYVMWVNTFGTAYRVHRLVSRDGLTWQWSKRIGPDGELGVGQKGSFDDRQRSYPTIIASQGEWRCWFTGNMFGETGIGYAVAPEQTVKEQ
jgi:hypothetical protein